MEEARVRFFKKVNKTDTCWLWTGSISRGYGQIAIKKTQHRTHRVSWLLAGNTIPEGHLIRHKCRNRHCVNPEHLETGTYQENALDRVRDGTMPWGEKQPNSKLTEEQVRAIRANPDNKTIVKLGEQYGIHNSTISKIILRKLWKHI